VTCFFIFLGLICLFAIFSTCKSLSDSPNSEDPDIAQQRYQDFRDGGYNTYYHPGHSHDCNDDGGYGGTC